MAGGIGETQGPQTRQLPGAAPPKPVERKDGGQLAVLIQEPNRDKRSSFLRRPVHAFKPGDPLPFNPRQYASVRAAFSGQNRFRQNVQVASTATDVLSRGLAQYRINVPVRRLKLRTLRTAIVYAQRVSPGKLVVSGDDLTEQQAELLSDYMTQQVPLLEAIGEMNVAAIEVLGFPNHVPPQPVPIEPNQRYFVDEHLGRVRYSDVTDSLVDTSDLESWIDGAIDFNRFAVNVNRYVQTGELPVKPERTRRGIYERTGGYLDNGYGAKVLGPIDQSTVRTNAPLRSGWQGMWSSYAAITLLDVDIAPRGELPTVNDFC
ncbi:hypothetical protein D7S86_08990 [Pararobbsia silviterrae]|uniref:Uncharacterized protein n=1 Tax=Pararobbsia silviterrae TaxID=1792498 RepID=A0A494Y155_9BURK|nr:hypothetical protein D7S86_08990 [Pararobbsia silviterrae]